MIEPWKRPQIIEQTQLLLDSYEHWLGTALCPREGSVEAQAKALYLAPFVVVSHGTEPDPILNYGNGLALELWDMGLETLLETPSSSTAEPIHQAERKRMLAQVTQRGFIDDYSGIRVSKTGIRFKIEGAIIWNVFSGRQEHRGEAATFSKWHYV